MRVPLLKRRDLLSALSLVAAYPAAAQGRIYRVGLLSPGEASLGAFRQYALPELAKDGFIEGGNLAIISRSSWGLAEPLRPLAREVADAKPDVVVAVSNPAAHAIRAADATLPIVMGFAGTDPVADGLATSLARPGGRVTGIVMLAEEADHKRIEFARQMMPGARRFGYLAGPTFTAGRVAAAERLAKGVGIELLVARSAGAEGLDQALSALRAAGAEAVIVGSFPGFSGNAVAVADAALANGLPSFCEWRHMAEAGCLVSFGPVYSELQRRVAFYVARILRGDSPGDLPMEQAGNLEFVLNLKTARRLSITVPPLMLMRANAVID